MMYRYQIQQHLMHKIDVIEHEIDVSPEFKPKRFRAYRVPEKLKPEVDKEIQLMLNAGIIRPSRSQMASPLVYILKGPEGREGIRLAVDYLFANKYTTGDALPLPDISSVFQRIGNAKFVSVVDCESGYWQLGVRDKDKWLTAFVCDVRIQSSVFWVKMQWELFCARCRNYPQTSFPVRCVLC